MDEKQQAHEEKNMEVSREQVKATDTEIEAAFEALGFSVCCDEEYGYDVAFGMASEIAEFAKRRSEWSDRGTLVTHTGDLFFVRSAQSYKGRPRREVILIRFGDHCAIYGMDQD